MDAFLLEIDWVKLDVERCVGPVRQKVFILQFTNVMYFQIQIVLNGTATDQNRSRLSTASPE